MNRTIRHSTHIRIRKHSRLISNNQVKSNIRSQTSQSRKVTLRVRLNCRPLTRTKPRSQSVSVHKPPIISVITPQVNTKLSHTRVMVTIHIHRHTPTTTRIQISKNRVNILLITVTTTNINLPSLSRHIQSKPHILIRRTTISSSTLTRQVTNPHMILSRIIISQISITITRGQTNSFKRQLLRKRRHRTQTTHSQNLMQKHRHQQVTNTITLIMFHQHGHQNKTSRITSFPKTTSDSTGASFTDLVT